MNQALRKLRRLWKKVWHFIWYEDSLLSWVVNIILAFIIVKFIVYPGIGLLLGTPYPLVVVVSSSMEHKINNDYVKFDEWWESNKDWYTQRSFTKQEMQSYPFTDGFNKGDIMVLYGEKPKSIKVGTIIVYKTESSANPIIHRVFDKWVESGTYYFKTKGDNNNRLLPFEDRIHENQIQGVSVLKIPYLGWIKIWFTELIT